MIAYHIRRIRNVTSREKKALVTGGSRGIGSAIAKRLAAEGATVAITYAGNKAAADATVAAIEDAGGTAYAFQADAADPASQRSGIEQAAGALGGLDILVHNAGIVEFAVVSDDTDENFDRQFGVNVKGLHVGTRAALPHLADGGRIILIGSIASQKGFPDKLRVQCNQGRRSGAGARLVKGPRSAEDLGQHCATRVD
ncbi:SDR family NAD(P)-dependent oxidoreductase [Novosphingobium colocasiae]